MKTLTLLLLIGFACLAQTPEAPVRSVTDSGVVTTNQRTTPAGVQSIFQGRVYGVAFGASSAELHVLQATGLYRMDWKENKVLQRIAIKGRMALQGITFLPDAGHALAVYTDAKAQVHIQKSSGDELADAAFLPKTALAGAIASNGSVLAVPLTATNELAVIDAKSGAVRGSVKTGIAPFGAVINAEGTVAYVSNWAGRVPRQGDLTAALGLDINADKAVVDARGIAASGTLTRIDLKTLSATHTIAVGLHPTALRWDEKRHLLYVANSNADTISVVDTRTNAVLRTIDLQPFPQRVRGISPTALALSPDGATLYAACGGINAVAVVDPSAGRILGLIPTAWVPNALAVSPDGRQLAVATLFGPGSGWSGEPKRRFVHSYRGSVNVITVPDRNLLASYTTAVAENNRMTLPAVPTPPATKPVAIPARSGDPSFIEHVVYIVKENRTYDQVFGDLPRGNGDPSLTMFGEKVTPNHHKLARDFVLLDNFYATGGNSADGHQWVTQASETAYCLWPGYEGRSYPFDGSDPLAYSSGGFLWDAALARGKSVRIFGEYAGRLSVPRQQRQRLLEEWKAGADFTKRWNITAPIAPVNKILARNFPSYTTGIPDVVRAQIFLAEFKQWEAAGQMPNLVIMSLPSNHTNGASPGTNTPQAMVADNDYALGQIVDALSHSPFWKKMAIFVVEDDAQNGVDHVDGHRTVALAISPYTRRQHVDSTFYANQSIVKTIELILGLPTLSLFDLIATDMRASFTDQPDFAPFAHLQPTHSLFEMNPSLNALRGPARQAAKDSARMNWDVPDAAPVERLNRIVWGQIKGWNTPYPAPKNAVFAPLAVPDADGDDDER